MVALQRFLTCNVSCCPRAAVRLRFVKLYYEFPPSCLYADARGTTAA